MSNKEATKLNKLITTQYQGSTHHERNKVHFHSDTNPQSSSLLSTPSHEHETEEPFQWMQQRKLPRLSPLKGEDDETNHMLVSIKA